jgi:hypothetical protein
MNAQAGPPLNKPLIVFTLVFVVLCEVSKRIQPTPTYSSKEALTIGVFALVFSPIFIVWTRALWNTLVPRIIWRLTLTTEKS